MEKEIEPGEDTQPAVVEQPEAAMEPPEHVEAEEIPFE